MKFTPEVIAALQVLRDNVENDFERHRIDVLERDLTSPPTVEVIDERTQIFDGEKFYVCKSGHPKQSVSIHRRLWKYYFGEIPEGCQIHHIDFNKTNNDISNLQLVTVAEHREIHMPKGVDVHKQKVFVCANCGKEYTASATGHNKFCSPQCYSKYRQKHKLTKRVCPQCGKEFKTYEQNTARFCSHACAMNAKRKHQPEKRICPVCGKKFVTLAYRNQKFCSRSCAAKGRKGGGA